MTTSNAELRNWVEETAKLTKPDRIHWCDGSDTENKNLIGEMTSGGTLIKLNPQTHPGCHLHRSDPTDVARTELLKRGTSHDHGARHLRARMESLINVEISRRLKVDERRRRTGYRRTLDYLRELKLGKRPFDLDEVRGRVMDQTRVRVPYRRFRVDLVDDDFTYEGVQEAN